METITTTELEEDTERVIKMAQEQPILIHQEGKEILVVTSSAEYNEFLKYKELKSGVRKGLDQIESGKFSTRSMADLASEARKRVDERRQKSA